MAVDFGGGVSFIPNMEPKPRTKLTHIDANSVMDLKRITVFFCCNETDEFLKEENSEECCRDLAILWQFLLHFVMFELIFRRFGFV